MGRQAYGIIGGVLGATAVAFFDPAATVQAYEAGFAVGAAIGGIAGSYIDPLVIQGNKVGDAQIQVAAEGGTRAMMYGRACVSATCVVARGNRKVTKKKQSNGKGSSGSTANEYVSWTFAIGLGEALVGASIARIWQDDNLVYDVLGDGAISESDNAAFLKKFKFYNGAEDQLPDPDLQVFLGANTPYFRGTAYVVFPNFDLTQQAERIPQFKFEILQGVAGIVDDLSTLQWDFPTHSGLVPISQSVTLEGSAATIWNIDFYFTGNIETRDYAHIIDRVGGGGRFVTATDDAEVNPLSDNIYKVVISDPPQTYYINAFLAGESEQIIVFPDGTDAWKLSVQCAGNATVTFAADPVDGTGGPEMCTCRAEITGTAVGGDATIPLSHVISDVLLKSGMVNDEFDVSALTDLMAGVCIQETATGADAVGSIVAPFFADPREQDAKLVFIKRGAAVVRTLTLDDLTEEPDVSTRQNSIEYPAKLSFFYQSPQTGYASTKATSYRYSPQADSSGEGSVTAPVTFYNSDEPAQIAQKLHKVAWTEAGGTFTWKVGLQCIDLLPADVLGLFLRGIVTRARITAIENDGTTLTLTLMNDRQSGYTSVVTGIPLPTPTPPQPTTMSKAVLGVLDIPALQDTDDDLNYYAAMSGLTRVWKGGQLQRSLDAGTTWTAIGEVITDTTMGLLTTAMTGWIAEYTDTVNTVVVQLFDSDNELVSYSETAFNQEQGAIALQMSDGTWEVMQYMNATDGGNGLYTLDTLKRGRLTTTPGSHSIGALFVHLDQYIVKNAAHTAWIEGTLKHRGVSYSLSAEDADIVTTTYAARSQLEWQPAAASVEYDGSVVAVSDIVPRHRFGTEVAPLASVNFTGFRVTATNGTDTATDDIGLTDDIALLALTGTPTAVTVAALNRITGPGPALALTEFEAAPPRDADVSVTQPAATATDGNRQVVWLKWAGYPTDDSDWAPPLSTTFTLYASKRGSDDIGTGAVLIYGQVATPSTTYGPDDMTRYNVVGGVGSGAHSSLVAGATAAGVDIEGFHRTDGPMPSDCCANWSDIDTPSWANWAFTLPKGEVSVVQSNPGSGMPIPGYSQWATYATSLPGDGTASPGSTRAYYSPTTAMFMENAVGFIAKVATSLPQIAQVNFERTTILAGIVLSVTVAGTTYTYTTNGTDTLSTSLTALAAIVNADSGCPATASVSGTVLVLTGKSVSVVIAITAQSSGHVLGTP